MTDGNYNIDAYTLSLIKDQEGFSAKAYVDAQGHSIGYGHFIKKGEEHLLNKSLTEEEATSLLQKDIAAHQAPWRGKLTKEISGQQMAALTSFAYNVGAHSKALPQMVKLINEGKEAEAGDLMMDYTKSRQGPTGQLVSLAVLEKRRAFERELLTSKSDILADHLSGKKRIKISENKSSFRTTFGATQGNNNDVLKALVELNNRIGANAPLTYNEGWAQRVLQEGRGG